MCHYSFVLPVVIRAEWIAAKDHIGWNDLLYIAAPNTCEQGIDVPDIILNCNVLLSQSISEGDEIGYQLAIVSTPRAIESGYNMKNK